MKQKRKIGLTPLLIMVTSVFLLVLNGVMGLLMMNQSKDAMPSLIRARMLDIANTAADDSQYRQIFNRADQAMYADKAEFYRVNGDRRKRRDWNKPAMYGK